MLFGTDLAFFPFVLRFSSFEPPNEILVAEIAAPPVVVVTFLLSVDVFLLNWFLHSTAVSVGLLTIG